MANDIIQYKPPIPNRGLWSNIRAYYGYANYKLKLFIGLKGIGKTFASKQLVINRFLYKGTKFLWLRDTEGAVDRMKEDGAKFFDIELRKKFPDVRMELKGSLFYINSKVAGSLESVSTFYKQKGNDYADYGTVVFDEAIPEKVQNKQAGFFLKLANVIKQVARLKNGKERGDIDFIFNANALDSGADVIVNFGFKNINKYGIYLNKTRMAMLVYLPDSKQYQHAVKESIAGKLLQNTEVDSNLNQGNFATNMDNIIDFRVTSTVKYIIVTNDGNFAVEKANAPFSLWYITNPKKGSYNGKWYTSDFSLQTQKIKYRKDIKKTLQEMVNYGIIEYENSNLRELFSNYMGGK